MPLGYRERSTSADLRLFSPKRCRHLLTMLGLARERYSARHDLGRPFPAGRKAFPDGRSPPARMGLPAIIGGIGRLQRNRADRSPRSVGTKS
jgi:predicted transcriptional regulator